MAQEFILLDELNERELEIILLLAEGLSNKEIANRLFLAPNTVKWYVRQLNSKLDTSNRDEIVARAAELGLLDAEQPPPPKHNLPYATTPFVGRKAELDKVHNLLINPDLRLLTLTGPGGIGKTRLALAVGSQMMDFFPDGIFFVPLASVGNPMFVVTEIARLFGLRDDAKDILFEKLVTVLREQRLLLILDNFEHLISAGPSVARLLRKTKQLKVLVTSREVLNVSGEHIFVVDTLTLPPPVAAVSDLEKYEASRLLLLRARAADVTFSPSDENTTQIVALCHYLEGLPLAIELAATRVSQLPISKLVSLLSTSEKRLSLLTSGPRDWHERQQTLRNTIDWSYQLLDGSEQTLFVRLSIFAGGCTLETAEQICNDTGDLPNVVEHMLSLVSKSLIKQHDVAGQPRFVMLESIREYAREKLLERDEAFQLHQALILYYLSLVENLEPLVADHATQYAVLDGELDNLRAVLAWSLSDENAGHATELGVRLAGSLSFFWYLRGMLNEGRYWLNLAAHAAMEPDVHRARIMHGLGLLAWQQGDHSVAVSAFEEGISLWRIVDYRSGLAEGLHLLGHAQFDQKEYEVAGKLFRESYTLYEEMNEIIATLPLISDLGLVAYHQHDYASAQELFNQSLALCREHDYKSGVMDATNRLGDLMRLAGNYEAATQLYEESLAVGYEVRSNLGIASAKHKLGCLAKHSGDIDQAKRFFLESLAIQEAAGNKQGILECLAGLAGIINDLPRTAKLFGAIEALLDNIGVPLAPADQRDYERDRDRVCSQPGVKCFDAPDEEKRSMTLEEAVAYARDYTQAHSPLN